MVTAIHSCFKLLVVCLLNPGKTDAVKTTLIEEVKVCAVSIETRASDSSSAEEKDEEDDFFKELQVTVAGLGLMELSCHNCLSNKLVKENES